MKIDLPVTKGIIFAGCSFTWGQGLYYYSNLPTLKEGTNSFNLKQLTYSQIEYMKSVRYPRLVAEHFKTFEIVSPTNGGAHKSIVTWWSSSLGIPSKESMINKKISCQEISTVVFQLTQTHRCRNLVLDKTDGYFIRCKQIVDRWLAKNNMTVGKYLGRYAISYNEAYFPKYEKLFERWLAKNNLTIDTYQEYYTRESLEQVKIFLTECEKRGLRTVIINWPKENVDYIKSDKWFCDRFLPLTYMDKEYDDIDTLMEEHPDMKISSDYKNFSSPPPDNHPSLDCHKLIAKNLITYLENV